MKKGTIIRLIIGMFAGIIIGILAGMFLSSCDKLVNDIRVTCINETDEQAYVRFFATDYPLPNVWNIVNNNDLPVLVTASVYPHESMNVIIYEPVRLDVWYGVYINDSLYVTGKINVYNPIIKIE